jgi:hypothetical protein
VLLSHGVGHGILATPDASDEERASFSTLGHLFDFSPRWSAAIQIAAWVRETPVGAIRYLEALPASCNWDSLHRSSNIFYGTDSPQDESTVSLTI